VLFALSHRVSLATHDVGQPALLEKTQQLLIKEPASRAPRESMFFPATAPAPPQNPLRRVPSRQLPLRQPACN